jgi:membrane protein
MNTAYDVEETRGFVGKLVRALLLTLVGSAGILIAFVTIVGGSVITEQAVATLGVGPDAWSTISLLRYPLMLALVAVAVAALFRFGPNVAVSFRWTMVGGVVFAVGWLIATALFGLYVANFGSYANTYGALGGVIVLMLWFYLTAMLLLVAAEVTAVLAKQHEPEKVDARRAETGPSGSAKSGRATETSPSRGPATPATQPAPVPDMASIASSPKPDRAVAAAAHRPLSSTLAMSRPVSWVGRVLAVVLVAVSAVVGAVAGRVVGNDDEASAK